MEHHWLVAQQPPVTKQEEAAAGEPSIIGTCHPRLAYEYQGMTEGYYLRHSCVALQAQCGVNFFILDSRRVLAPAPKVLGPKHISNPDFAPF